MAEVSPLEWQFGPFRLEANACCLRRGQETIPLQPKDGAVLHYLLAHAGRTISLDELLTMLWPESTVGAYVLRNCIARLRHALSDAAQHPRYIQTVPRQGYRFLVTPRAVTHGGGALARPGTPELVGREAALQQLHGWLRQALAGQHQLVRITGEIGIGKTALVQAFEAEVAATGGWVVAHGQCVEHSGSGEPYRPLLEALDRLCRGPQGARLVTVLRQEAPTWLVQLPGLLAPNVLAGVQRQLVGVTQTRMLREFTVALERFSREQPLVLVLEDVHWSDAATLDALAVLAQRRDPARLLVLTTARPEVLSDPAQPWATMLPRLRQHHQGSELRLGRLDAAAVAAYVSAHQPMWGQSPSLLEWIYRRTEGHPLVLVSMSEELARHQAVATAASPEALAAAVRDAGRQIPATLRQLFAGHLARLSQDEREVLAVASVVGVTGSTAAVAAGLEVEVFEAEARCATLAQRGVFLAMQAPMPWPDGTLAAGYRFQHALYCQVVYDSLLTAQRRVLHQRIAERLETAYGSEIETVAALLAMHWQQAGQVPQVVRYSQIAAAQALRCYANREALGHLTTALRGLATLPRTPDRSRMELELQLSRAAALAATQGFVTPEAAETYAQARSLGAQMGEPIALARAEWGLLTFHAARGAWRMAQTHVTALETLAQRQDAPHLALMAQFARGAWTHYTGNFATSLASLQRCCTTYAAVPHQDVMPLSGFHLGASAYACLARTSWCLGHVEQAAKQRDIALSIAEELTHPFALTTVLTWLSIMAWWRREWAMVQAQAEMACRLSADHGFTFYRILPAALRGRARMAMGHLAEGLTLIQQAVEERRRIGSGEDLYLLTLLADAYRLCRQPAAGQAVVAEALAVVAHQERHDLEAELHRLAGEFHLLEGACAAADAAARQWQQALEIARRQQAKSWELRAAMDLSRLWYRQGKHDPALQLLAEVYAQFTEGFDTADLQDARDLLDKLTARASTLPDVLRTP